MNAQQQQQSTFDYNIKVIDNIDITDYNINPAMSLYIPHVFPNFTSEYIARVFELLEIGYVDHVDMVAKLDKNGRPYNSAYIHFAEWCNTIITKNFQKRVLDPEREALIVHDDPWYWIVLENKGKKHVPGERKICIHPPLGKVLQSEEPNPQDNFAPLFTNVLALQKVDVEPKLSGNFAELLTNVLALQKVDVDFDTFPELSDSETDVLISEIYNEEMDVECVFAS